MDDNDLSTRGAKRPCLDSHSLSDFSNLDSDTGELPIIVQAQTEPTLEHVKELWFEDGSIILVSENHGFKVYHGILKQHSTYFRTQAPSISGLEESLDGVKIMNLPSHWRHMDVKNILMVFLSPNYFSRRLVEPNHQPFLASLLYTSQRMEIPSIRKDVLRELQKLYPSDTFPKTTITKYSTSDIISVIYAVRLTAYDAFLPAAFYRLSLKSMEDLMALVSPEDTTGNKPALSYEDLTTCLVGREKLLKRYQSLWNTATQAINHPCKDCPFDISVLARSSPVQNHLFCPSIFSGLEKVLQKAVPKKNFCRKCKTQFWESVEKTRKEVWEELPTIFKLPDWSTLRQELELDL